MKGYKRTSHVSVCLLATCFKSLCILALPTIIIVIVYLPVIIDIGTVMLCLRSDLAAVHHLHGCRCQLEFGHNLL